MCWLCWFLIYNRVTYKYTYIPSLLYFPPTPSFPPFKVITEHQAELPVLNSSFPLSIYLTYGEMYVCVCVCVCIYIYIYICQLYSLNLLPPTFPAVFLMSVRITKSCQKYNSLWPPQALSRNRVKLPGAMHSFIQIFALFNNYMCCVYLIMYKSPP